MELASGATRPIDLENGDEDVLSAKAGDRTAINGDAEAVVVLLGDTIPSVTRVPT